MRPLSRTSPLPHAAHPAPAATRAPASFTGAPAGAAEATWDTIACNRLKCPRFGKIGVLTHGADIGVVDYEPPTENGKAPLFYVFKNGFKDSLGYDKATYGIETIRAQIHQAKSDGVHRASPLSAEMLARRYACTPEAARAQGWRGDLNRDALPVHTWEQLKDHVLGYPDALSNDPAVRRRGRVRGRFKLWYKGLRTTFNRVEEASSKGARTMFTSFPGQLAIGVMVASPVIAYLAMDAHAAHVQKTSQ